MESESQRPRQARYQAALRPDMKSFIDSKALTNSVATLKPHFRPQLRRTLPYLKYLAQRPAKSKIRMSWEMRHAFRACRII